MGKPSGPQYSIGSRTFASTLAVRIKTGNVDGIEVIRGEGGVGEEEEGKEL